ncbi:major facilitator superfamily transporter [Arthrobacter globiformis NBRC 12137]|uniref:Major facilitator superfamily transporter n=1 Tax=Arthrobacter globiformis (strain ATCC 8010 / DSM 20124 / JCM 1332 / NBRC 12137 / NCIMB 8907 / NRRL B-2979 / 168) TaxID=1077972 RepID=H0QJU8_ARTG1|nr:MFS transporter [Arthrobacter globiformis]GAB13099.1 major facilitator superfamily transporter [Arthrobacter globiformis NBRC 12137]
MSQTQSSPVSPSTPQSAKGLGAQATTAVRTFFISGFGTALEFYDFIVYGLAAALVFPTLFFPATDRLTGTLMAFAAFGAGFIVRPLGGIVVGHFGDRLGRKSMLVMTLLLMGTSTFLIGCLPTYDNLGLFAPVLLVALRLVQGFAAGGEWGGAALFGIENSPQNRRGLWGSFTSTGIGIGSLFGTGVFTVMTLLPESELLAWAWRVPFWLGGLLVLVGIIARTRRAFFFLFFGMVDSQVIFLATVAFILVNLFMAMPQGCIPAFLGEQFSKESRYSSISATYQTGAALGGGTAASIATALFIAFNRGSLGIALYSGLACLVLVLCVLGLKETSKVPTTELGEEP